MMEVHKYKNLVIGFGKGGKTLAAFLAGKNEPVAIIEQSAAMYGGSCINVACIPTKSLIVQAERNVDYQEAYQVKENLVTGLREKNFEKINSLENATVFTGKASFLSQNEVKVNHPDGKESRITAERIFINTGTVPAIPPIEGVNSGKVFTSITMMEEQRLPGEIIIVGGGFVGLEFADMFAKFGKKVTVLDRRDTFLPDEDEDISQEIFKILSGKGIRILNGVTVEKIEDIDPASVRVYYSQNGERGTLDAGAVLMATGRKPDTADLNLEAAGIETDERGFIEVDDDLRTNIHHIWAIGDINGGPQFTYISLDDFRIIKNQLTECLTYTSIYEREDFPTCVFISPPLARAGFNEKEAKEVGYRFRVVKMRAEAIPKAAILKEQQGLLKAVIDLDTNKIVGCTLLCAEAHEIINTVQLAMNTGLTYTALRDTIYTHPSMSEALNELFQ